MANAFRADCWRSSTGRSFESPSGQPYSPARSMTFSRSRSGSLCGLPDGCPMASLAGRNGEPPEGFIFRGLWHGCGGWI